jgi:hypothetical protein
MKTRERLFSGEETVATAGQQLCHSLLHYLPGYCFSWLREGYCKGSGTMSESPVLVLAPGEKAHDLGAAALQLRAMVLQAVASENSKRNYAKALDEIFTLCANRLQGISRALLMEYRASMIDRKLSPSTINVRLSAIRKLIGEASPTASSIANKPRRWRTCRTCGSRSRKACTKGRILQKSLPPF